jgi:hypothetical protein
MRRRLGLSVVLAALVASSSIPARADGVLPATATPVQREQAQARFARGKELLGKKQYEAALAEFRASHEIVASPNTRLELARCLRAMGKLVAAYAELGRAAVEAKELVGQDNRYQRAFDSASSERAEIEPQLGFATLTIQNATDDTKVIVGGEELRRAAWGEPTPIVAGDTEVAVETSGHATVKRTLTLAAGQKTSLAIDALSGDPAPAPPAPPVAPPAEGGASPLRVAAYVAGGVGVAGLATFTIAGLMAHSTYDDLNRACQGGPCPPDKTGEISSGKTQQTIANVGLIVGIAGVAAGVTLFVLSPSKASPGPTTGVVMAPGWLGVHGRF